MLRAKMRFEIKLFGVNIWIWEKISIILK
jgi:hypothetical protein